MRPSRVLVKIGGAALHNDFTLETVTEAIKGYRDYGYQVILVHGGGPAINQELTRRGIAWSFVNGQRVTSPQMMEVIEMTLCGKVNKQIVRYFGAQGIPAVGISGSDCKTLLCSQESEELGLVGTIQKVQTDWIENILKLPNSPLPVIAPVGVDENGASFNINADWAASNLAVALKVEYLIFLTDQKGILDEQKNLLKKIRTSDLQNLIDTNTVRGGMLTKTRTILHALTSGTKAIRVMDARDSVDGLWSDWVGTWCVSEDVYQQDFSHAAH